jgi:hypothetical protein
MKLLDRIQELEQAGASVLVQAQKQIGEGKFLVDLYVFLPAINGLRKTEKAKLFVDNAGSENETADYLDSVPSILVAIVEPTPIATEEALLAATEVKWIKYDIAHTGDSAVVSGIVSLSEKEAVSQSWIVAEEKGALVAYQQK